MLSAQQIMTTGVVTIQPESTIEEAIELLLQKRVSGLPVVDATGNLVGMITEYALLALVYDKNVLHDRVGQFMTRQLLSVEFDTPITEIANQFILHRVRRLPVTRGGRLVGLVSRSDVLRGLYGSVAPVCTA
jgi:CBS domain-containing protein